MYKIEKRPSGYILTFADAINAEEMTQWKEESKSILQTEVSKSFGVIIDMRDLKPLTEDAQKIMVEGQHLYKNAGMFRSAVILANTIIYMQFKRLAKQSGIYDTERYIDASKTINPIDTAINWVKDAIDPDA